MPNSYFGDDIDPEFIPKLIPRGPTGIIWGYSLFIDQIGPNFFCWTFLANNRIKMPNSYFGDDLDPEFIPKRIHWG